RPVLAEVLGWLCYLVPVGLYVAWPPGRTVPHRRLAAVLTSAAVASIIAALILVMNAPAAMNTKPVTSDQRISARVLSASGDGVVVQAQLRHGATPSTLRLQSTGLTRHLGVLTAVYSTTAAAPASRSLPATMTVEQVSTLNGGRLPLGVRPTA